LETFKFFQAFITKTDYLKEFQHLEIRLLREKSSYGNHPEFSLTWQRNARELPVFWYGMHYKIQADREEELAMAYAWVKRLAKHLPDYGATPQDFLAGMTSGLKMKEVVYDSRESEFVELKDVKPDDIKVYRDDWQSVSGATGCQHWVYAKNWDEARLKMKLELYQKEQERREFDDNKGYYERWVAADEPMIWMSDHQAPDTTPILEKLAALSPKEAEKEEEATV
jgi:hypothetical protein